MTKYVGSNIGLNYNAEEGTWNFTNLANDFIDTDTFSTADPEFPTAPVESDDDTEEETPNCPPGYRYDETLKQCVPNPEQSYYNYNQNQTTGGGAPAENFILSDAKRESLIQEGNAEEYIANLKKRGFVKEVDGKLFLKTNSFGQNLASGFLSRVGLGGEPKAKMNRIIQDLMRMGAVNLQTNASIDTELTGLTGEPTLGINLADDLEISDIAGAFPTYQFSLEDMQKGNISPFAFQTFSPSGSTDKFKTFTDYINSLQQVKTSVANVGADVKRGDLEYNIKEEEAAREAKAKADKAEAEAKMAQLQVEGFQVGQDTQQQQDKKEEFVQQQQTQGKSKSEAEREYNKQLAQQALDKGTEVPTGTGGLLGSSFDKDPTGYTESKLKEAAKTGIFKGF
jgi:hypothetical protein